MGSERLSAENEASRPGSPVPAVPLFRPEALAEPEYGEAFAFAIPAWRSLALLAAGAVLLFLGFAALADFDRVTQVPGKIMPRAGIARVLAPQAGIVTAVSVRRGDRVERDSPLIRILAPDRLMDGAREAEALSETYRRQRQLSLAAAAAESDRNKLERQRLRSRLEELSITLSSIREQAALQQQRIASNEQRLRNLEPLRARGFVSENTYREQEEAVLALRQQLADLRRREAEASQGLAASLAQLAELEREARRTELEAAGDQVALERGVAAAESESGAMLAAPASGRVAALRVAPGSAVNAGDEVAAIVPSGRLEALLFVPPEAIGFLQPGQAVALRYDAFPYQHHGVGRGVVVDVADAALVEQPGSPPTYRVRVRLTDPGRLPLRPDMTLSAAVTLERRSLLGWLFTPLRERWRQNRHDS